MTRFQLEPKALPPEVVRLLPDGTELTVHFDYWNNSWELRAGGSTIGYVDEDDIEDYGWDQAARRAFECIHPGCRRFVQCTIGKVLVSVVENESRASVYSLCDGHADEYREWSPEKNDRLLREAARRGMQLREGKSE